MRAPTRWTIYNGRHAAVRLAAVNGRGILPGDWTPTDLLNDGRDAQKGSK